MIFHGIDEAKISGLFLEVENYLLYRGKETIHSETEWIIN